MIRLAPAWGLAALAFAATTAAGAGLGDELPWREAGLTERQAAAHLLDRLAYGPRPGQIDQLVELGLGNWIEGQLAGDLPGSVLDAKLARLPALAESPSQIVRRYSYGKSVLVREAVAAGVISMADYSGRQGQTRLRAALAALDRFAVERGLKPQAKLIAQLKAQKLLRAVHSESQLTEVLTDFWFNHFNVSIQDEADIHVLAYERDAIRPHVLASFRRLLGAVARHPAMLLYLGNARSVADARRTTVFDLEIQDLDRLSPGDNPTLRQELAKRLGWLSRRRSPGRQTGLNENYARELLELHTLGVDGGYRQRDVIEVARAFTGWTTFPPGGARDRIETALVDDETAETARDMGFVVEDEFVFRADQHDAEAKTVLGATLPAGRGIEDGEEVLDLLAGHPATRRRLARKLAIRFVAERPPATLVRRLEETWELSDGDLSELIRTLVRSPEFWSGDARRAKVKSPFDLAVSALRALDADISEPKTLLRLISEMGQPVYAYAAPTGFPDRADYWANVGTLLGRINFGLKLATGKIPGVRLDLLRPLGKRRLESLEEAADAYFPVLMPERDPTPTLALIASDESADAAPPAEPEPEPPATPIRKGRTEAPARRSRAEPDLTPTHAARAVGMLIASPEFQVK